jgi:hypothetical protein
VPIFLSAMDLLHFILFEQSSKNMRKIQFLLILLLLFNGLPQCIFLGRHT